jgi:serine protease Do
MKFKKLLPLAVSLTLLSPQAFAADNASVVVNGQALSEDAYIINDRVYVPLRAAGEALGASVSWDDSAKTAILEKSDDSAAINAIATASESVVAIVGRYKSRYMSTSAQDYNELYAHGAGVIIKSNGTILTNAHVVDEIDNITVIFANGDSYSAALLYSDSDSDLAVVKINKLGLKPITFAKENSLVVGQSVIAIGTPLSLSMINSASRGIVSGTGVNIGNQYLFTQSDVSINGGNSGGPLINLSGELVGINSIKYTGSNIEGMSFSIPVDTINYVISSFETYGKVLRPNIGVTLTESWESKLGLPTKKGLSVSASQNPLLLSGDSVTKVNGIDVHSIADYNEVLKKTYTGGSVTFTYLRNNVEGTAEIEPLSD